MLAAQQTALEIITNICSKDIDLGPGALMRRSAVTHAEDGWEEAGSDDEAPSAMHDQQQPHMPHTGARIHRRRPDSPHAEVSMDILSLLAQLAIPMRVCCLH